MTSNDLLSWQRQFVPLAKKTIIGLMVFFFTASFTQLIYLHIKMGETHPSLTAAYSKHHLEQGAESSEHTKIIFLVSSLEADAMQRRYHQANIALMARIWVSYLGFVTGMMLALIGSTFIISKLQEEKSTVSGGSGDKKWFLESSSPGVILVTLGVLLMFATIAIKHDITIKDSMLYLDNIDTLLPETATEAKPEL